MPVSLFYSLSFKQSSFHFLRLDAARIDLYPVDIDGLDFDNDEDRDGAMMDLSDDEE